MYRDLRHLEVDRVPSAERLGVPGRLRDSRALASSFVCWPNILVCLNVKFPGKLVGQDTIDDIPSGKVTAPNGSGVDRSGPCGHVELLVNVTCRLEVFNVLDSEFNCMMFVLAHGVIVLYALVPELARLCFTTSGQFPV